MLWSVLITALDNDYLSQALQIVLIYPNKDLKEELMSQALHMGVIQKMIDSFDILNDRNDNNSNN
ncbi:MAG TPA: hypothetical protein VJ729_03040 [Nitrososphaeraceae archaeon]|nr:hypothetical protein [Nitrososphaeraceae archaeon]